MNVKEIRRKARSLSWTRDQAMFLSDRIRNALVVLGNPSANPSSRIEAQGKLLTTIEAIEDATMADLRVSIDLDRPDPE